jgi:TRAP-type C4-dicarboxylate transport system substrate-binding protein
MRVMPTTVPHTGRKVIGAAHEAALRLATMCPARRAPRFGGMTHVNGLSRVMAGLALSVLLTGASACSGSDVTKAGGTERVTLRLADGYATLDYVPAVARFVEQAQQRSGGALHIDVAHGWGKLQPDFEQQIVRAVAAGQVDLAWVGTRSLDTLGVPSFAPLTAPLLVDSYPVQDAVLRSDLPARLLPRLDRLGVRGLAVLPGGLRKPIAVRRPLRGPAEWRGMTFQAFRSQGQAAAVRALGAKPTDVVGDGLDAGLADGSIGGFEKNLLVYSINNMERTAPYVTLNVNLWPETIVLLANPHRLAGLSGRQADWLRAAAADAATRSAQFAGIDGSLIPELCGKGARFATASAADLTGLRAAVAPVYVRLERDPSTSATMVRIEELKRSTAAPAGPAVPAGCGDRDPIAPTVSSAQAQAQALMGTWRTARIPPERVHAVVERAGATQAEADHFVAQSGSGSPRHSIQFELRIGASSWQQYEQTDGGALIHGWDGTYTVDGSTVHAVDETGGCRIDYAVTVAGRRLTFRVLSVSCGRNDLLAQHAIYESAPFTRQD